MYVWGHPQYQGTPHVCVGTSPISRDSPCMCGDIHNIKGLPMNVWGHPQYQGTPHECVGTSTISNNSHIYIYRYSQYQGTLHIHLKTPSIPLIISLITTTFWTPTAFEKERKY
jgi:hypothetical protein